MSLMVESVYFNNVGTFRADFNPVISSFFNLIVHSGGFVSDKFVQELQNSKSALPISFSFSEPQLCDLRATGSAASRALTDSIHVASVSVYF